MTDRQKLELDIRDGYRGKDGKLTIKGYVCGGKEVIQNRMCDVSIFMEHEVFHLRGFVGSAEEPFNLSKHVAIAFPEPGAAETWLFEHLDLIIRAFNLIDSVQGFIDDNSCHD